MWSTNSKNKVPVASLHTVEEHAQVDRRENAMALFAEAYRTAMGALNELQNFTDNNLEVVLFSGENFVHLWVFLTCEKFVCVLSDICVLF